MYPSGISLFLDNRYIDNYGALLEMWIIGDSRMLNYGLAGRSQNVLFNLLVLN